MELMTTLCGNRRNFQALGKLLQEYNLGDKKLTEFSELDKIVYRNIKSFVGMI